MTRRFLIAAFIAVVVVVAGRGALYQWLVPGLSSARQSRGRSKPKSRHGSCTGVFLTTRKRAPIRWRPIRPRSPPGAISSARNAKPATVMTAAEKRKSVQGNIRGRRHCVPWTSRRCRMAKFFITSATASETPACRRGRCRTSRSGSLSLSFAICRTSRRSRAAGDRAAKASRRLPRNMPARPPAKNAMRISMRAGANRGWRTWCAIRASIPTRSFPTCPSLIPLVNFSKDDIALVYGSRWKQRYFTKIGDDYFPEPAQWDVTHKMWRRYFVPNTADWWAPLYPPDNFKRPTGTALRRLPFGELRHRDQNRQRMECRLRKVPRTRQRTRRPPGARQYPQSGPLRLCPCQ